MLNDATGFDKIFIATGYTDLRRGIDGLASTIKYQFELDPFQKNILFLFCGKRTDQIKGLVWKAAKYRWVQLALHKERSHGDYARPYHMLMQGLESDGSKKEELKATAVYAPVLEEKEKKRILE